MPIFWSGLSAYTALAVLVAWIAGQLNLTFFIFAALGLVVVGIPCYDIDRSISAKSAITSKLKEWDKEKVQALERIVRRRLFTRSGTTETSEEAAERAISEFLEQQSQTPSGRLALEAMFQRSEIGRRRYLRDITGGRVE